MTFDDWWGAYPTQEDYEDNCRDAWEASAASRNAEITELCHKLAAKQAEVDALTLEYCPSEMSQEQLDNWAAHQRPAKEQPE
jgi:hypothetical protein